MLALTWRALRAHLPTMALHVIGLATTLAAVLAGVAILLAGTSASLPGSGCADEVLRIAARTHAGDYVMQWSGWQARALAQAASPSLHARAMAVGQPLALRDGSRSVGIAFVTERYWELMCVQPTRVPAAAPDGAYVSSALRPYLPDATSVALRHAHLPVAGWVEGFTGESQTLPDDLWLPWNTPGVLDEEPETIGEAVTTVWVRPRDARERARIEARLAAVLAEHRSQFPDVERFLLLPPSRFSPAKAERWRAGAQSLVVFASLLVLLVLCNMTNERVSRSAEDAKLLATLRSLGAPRRDLLRYVLAEPLLTFLLAAGLAAGLYAGAAAVMSRHAPIAFHDARMAGAVAVTLAGLLAALLLGGAARLLALNPRRLVPGHRAYRILVPFLPWLVAVQLGVLFVALALATLVARNWWTLLPPAPTYEVGGLTLLTFRTSGYGDGLEQPELGLEQVRRRLPSGWQVAMASSHLPFERYVGTTSIEADGDKFLVKFNEVTPGFFDVLGLTVQGEAWRSAWASSGAACRAIVNRQLLAGLPRARRPEPGILRVGANTCDVVGVVDEGSNGRVAGASSRLTTPMPTDASGLGPIVYLPLHAVPAGRLVTIFVRHPEDAGTAAVQSAVLAAGGDVFPGLEFQDAMSGAQAYAHPLWKERLLTVVFLLFAASMMAIAATGVIAFIRNYCHLHRSELALAFAVGATPRQALAAIAGRAVLPLAVCLTAAVVASLFLAALLARYLLEQEDGVGFSLAVGGVVLAAIVLGCAHLQLRAMESNWSVKDMFRL